VDRNGTNMTMAESLAQALVSDRSSERKRLQDEISRLQEQINRMNQNGCEHAATCEKLHKAGACMA
jgi:signal transduction protein with GAF and PtsI domain